MEKSRAMWDLYTEIFTEQRDPPSRRLAFSPRGKAIAKARRTRGASAASLNVEPRQQQRW